MKIASSASVVLLALAPALAACGNDAPPEKTSPEPKPAATTEAKPASTPAATAAEAASQAPAASGAPAASAAPAGSASAAEGEPKTEAKGPFPASSDPLMKDPKKADEGKVPKEFKVKFETTQGDFVVECKREWAEHGVDRFYHLVKIGFFDDVAFFRVVKGFVVQFGIHGSPEVAKTWKDANLAVDPVKESNKKGWLTYAMAGSPTTRSTQLFINLGDNDKLDKMKFSPICKVEGNGMDVVEKLEGSYNETPSRQQDRIQTEGNTFLRKVYPKLDYIKTARIEGKDGKEKGDKGDKKKKKAE